MNLNGRGGKDDLEGIGAGKMVLRIYCLKKNLFFFFIYSSIIYCILTTFSSSFTLPSSPSPAISSLLLFPSEKGRPPRDINPKWPNKKGLGTNPLIKAGQGNPAGEKKVPKSRQNSQRQPPLSLLRVPQERQATQS